MCLKASSPFSSSVLAAAEAATSRNAAPRVSPGSTRKPANLVVTNPDRREKYKFNDTAREQPEREPTNIPTYRHHKYRMPHQKNRISTRAGRLSRPETSHSPVYATALSDGAAKAAGFTLCEMGQNGARQDQKRFNQRQERTKITTE
jgi:hypothetical protein